MFRETADVCACTCHVVHLEVRGQFVGISCLLPLRAGTHDIRPSVIPASPPPRVHYCVECIQYRQNSLDMLGVQKMRKKPATSERRT